MFDDVCDPLPYNLFDWVLMTDAVIGMGKVNIDKIVSFHCFEQFEFILTFEFHPLPSCKIVIDDCSIIFLHLASLHFGLWIFVRIIDEVFRRDPLDGRFGATKAKKIEHPIYLKYVLINNHQMKIT